MPKDIIFCLLNGHLVSLYLHENYTLLAKRLLREAIAGSYSADEGY